MACLALASGCSVAFCDTRTDAELARIELSLPQAVALALRDNRTIRSAFLQRITQQFDLRIAEDRFRPKAIITSSYTLKRDNFDEASGTYIDATPTVTLLTPIGTQLALFWTKSMATPEAGDFTSVSELGLTITQPLLKGAGRNAATAPLRLAEFDEAINRLNLRATVAQVVTDIALAYREYLLTIERWRINRDALERSRDLLKINQAMVDSGRMARVELVQNESDIANQELALEAAFNSRESARLALLEKLALDPKTEVIPNERLDGTPPIIDLDRALTTARAMQPAYLTQIIFIQRAKLGVDIARDQRQWDVSLVAGVSRVSVDTFRSQWNSYGGVQMALPFGDLSLDRGVVQAETALRMAELQMDGARQRLEHQVRDAVRNVETRWRQVEIARRAKDLASKKLEIEREKLKAGRSTNFQVLSFESDLRAAESARVNALIDYMNALTLLDQQAGTTLDTWKILLEE